MSSYSLLSYINSDGQTLTDPAASSFWAAVGSNQTLTANGLNDWFYIYSPTDQVVLPSSHGIDTVNDGAWDSTYTLQTGFQNMILSGNVQVGVGNTANNLIIAETGTATMSGGGGDDIFVDGGGPDTIIDPQGSGNDVIYDFKHGVDQVDLENSTNLYSFSEVRSSMKQVGSDVVLTMAGNETLTFRNTTVGAFVPSDFWLPVNTSAMTLTFDDEFNTLNASPTGVGTTWQTTYSGDMRTNGGGEYYSDSSVGINPFSVSNGTLTISATPVTPSAATDNLGYVSGVVTTQHSFSQLYGYFDIRAEMPSASGFWPAFWLLPANNTWPPELDAVEQLTSNPTSDFVTAHTDETGTATQFSFNVNTSNTSQGFNNYGVYWGPDYIRWYFNGQEVAQTATPSDMNTAMYMLVNLGVVTSSGSWEGAAAASGSSAQMLVDYVHAYAYTGSDPMITGYPSTSTSSITSTASTASAAASTAVATPTSGTAATAALSTTQLNFGTVHVGQSVSQSVTVTNSAAGSKVDPLTGGFSMVTGAYAGTGTLGAGLASGASTNLQVALSTSTSGAAYGTATLGLSSADPVLGASSVPVSSIQLTGTVDNYASLGLSLVGSTATLSQSGNNYTLNLGTISPQSSGETDGVVISNNATGVADQLSASISAATVAGLYNSGQTQVYDLAAGKSSSAFNVVFADGVSGVYSETVVIAASGTNGSGYVGALPTETLTVTGTISPYYTLTLGADYISGGNNNDTIVTNAADLGTNDSIYGGGGSNTLDLVGGGSFNLSEIASLSAVQFVDVQEGAGAAEQTVTMRNYFNAIVNVQSETGGGVVIYGENDNDEFLLGLGHDSVYLGSSRETVIGRGHGTIYAGGSNLGATIEGGGSGSTLVVTASGTLGAKVSTLGSIDLASTGTLISFGAGTLASVGIMGSSSGGDTITLGASSQSVVGGGSNEHVLATAAVANAQVSGLGANSTFEITTAGTIALNAATGGTASAPLTVKLDKASHLTLSGMSFITATGSSGTDVITAGGGNQTLVGGGGQDTLVGYSGGNDTFKDTSVDLNGSTILNFSKTDLLNLTNLSFGSAAVTYSSSGNLVVTDSSHAASIALPGSFATSGFSLSSDPHGGVDIMLKS